MIGHYIYVIYFEWRITIIILLPSVGWKELGEKRCARKKKLLENRKDGGVGSGGWWWQRAQKWLKRFKENK
jgi:hypothetical protein